MKKKIFGLFSILAIAIVLLSFRGQGMGEGGYYFGYHSFVSFADTVYVSMLQFTGGAPASGNVLQSDANGNAYWGSTIGNYTLDSVTAYSGTVIPLAVNSTYTIIAPPGFTSIGMDTFSMPAGVTGNWIHVIWTIKDSVVRYKGSGFVTTRLTTAPVSTDYTFVNNGGNWH